MFRVKLLLKQIHQDWISHGRDWTLPGFRAVAIYRLGVWRYGIAPRLVRIPFSLLYKVLFRHARSVYGIEIRDSASIGENFVVDHQSGIVIHGGCLIGDGCRIRQNVCLGIKSVDDLHAVPQLGNNVDIGAGAVLLGAIKIGDNVVIGANSVVLKDVAANKIVVGAPAREIN